MVTSNLAKHRHHRTRRAMFRSVSCSANTWARCSPLLFTAAAPYDQQLELAQQLRRPSTNKALARPAPAALSNAISWYGFEIELAELDDAQSPNASAATSAQNRMASERGAIFGIPTAPNARNRTADGVDEPAGYFKDVDCYTPKQIADMTLPGSGYRCVSVWTQSATFAGTNLPWLHL